MAKPNSNPRIPRMASSRVMASSSTADTDLARQSSLFSSAVANLPSSAGGDAIKILGSMSMEDILRNSYPENAAPFAGGEASASGSRQGSLALPKEIGSKTVEEVWREITAGRKADEGVLPAGGDRSGGQMTLEDFLARAGAAREEELGVPSGSAQGGFGVDAVMDGALDQQQQLLPLENPVLGFGNEVVGGGGRGGRGGKRPVLDAVDRAALQRQKRMIKNRESAARSRQRKQA